MSTHKIHDSNRLQLRRNANLQQARFDTVNFNVFLEEQLGGDLQLARAVERVVRAAHGPEFAEACTGKRCNATLDNRARGSAGAAGAGSGSCARRSVRRVCCVHARDDGVVEQVERLTDELNVDVFVDRYIACDAEVEVLESRSNDAVTADLRG